MAPQTGKDAGILKAVRVSMKKRTTVSRSGRGMAAARLVCLAVLLWAVSLSSALAQETQAKVVRVGFFPCPFNIRDENGHMSGYAYDYQQDLAAYTGWTYEYVEASWPELLQMLRRGEIDLLSDVSYTPEREGEMLFSAHAMGTESYYLYIRNRDTDIDRQDDSTLNGKRIGINAGSLQAELFDEWAQKNGVQAEVIPCNGDNAMQGMMASGELDAVVAVDSYSFENTVPMVRIGGSDFYFAINAERPDLKAELDDAMVLLLSQNRYYNESLYQKYLNANANKSLQAEDLAWLQAHGTIRVGYLDDYLAYCDRDDATGELTGALRDFLSIAQDSLYNATLAFEPVAFPNAVEMRAALRDGEVDCIFPIYFDRYYAEQTQLYVTRSVAGTSVLALVGSGGFNENAANTVAVPTKNTATRLYVQNNYPSWTMVEAASEQDCLDMVRRGRADCAIFNANRVDHIIQAHRYDGLMGITLSCNTSVSFAVRRDNTHLLHILNQMIDAVPASTVYGALTSYATAPKRITLADVLRENMTEVFALAGIIIAVLGFMLYRMYGYGRRLAAALEEARREKEHANMLNLYNRELEEAANNDALTRIGNRNFFFARVNELLKGEERFAICYCDLDNLKSINDHHGHAEGDCYLRRFVDIVKSQIRAGDIFARIGGDEFCVVLKGCGKETAARKIRLMQRMFAEDARAYPQSFSCGITEVPAAHDAIEAMDILKEADAKMYEQKKEHQRRFRQLSG